jgi:aspartyl-tRNA(Asn)/glutamyl-tRNA(Gln) amidotransferase subunit A
VSAADLPYLTIAELAERYRRKDVSPLEVTRYVLERIERQERQLNAYILRTPEMALRQAGDSEARLRRGAARSPLEGVPFSLKDILDVEGLPTTCASNVLRGDPPARRSAFVAQQLLDAGAVLVGKTNMLEFAYGETHPDFGHTRNPWNLSRSTAGSSTGSAASVAAGQVYFSIGTDTGGSIRLPASYCGLVGIKPTYGRVSRRGVTPLSWSCDYVGPLARTVADAAAVLQVIAGHDGDDPTSAARPVGDLQRGLAGPVKGLRLGVVRREFEEQIHDDVRAACLVALEVFRHLGAEVVEVEAPPFLDAVVALLAILLVEAAAYHRPWVAARASGYSAAVLERLKMGALVPAVDYVHAQRVRREFREGIAAGFGQVDLLVTPTSPAPAHDFSEEVPGRDFTPYVRRTCPFNLIGFPAVSVPCGLSADGLPLGLQLVGRPFDEGTMLRAARAYEQATPWHTRRPQFM